MLIDFWGRGKSTLMYNFCYEVNKKLFFPSNFPQTLALYVNYPHKAQDLLDYTYENGLPLPWTHKDRKDELHDTRRDLFARALRMLAYAWVRKACLDEDFDSNPAIHTVDSKKLMHGNLLKIIECVDKLQRKAIYRSLAGFLNSFLKHSFRHKKLDGEAPLSSQTIKYLPSLLYPESSATFLESYSRLFSEPRKGLRNFLEFHRVCELVNIHLLMVVDEAEDWNRMAKTRLDDFLIEILPTNRLSVILILRTEVLNRLRGVQKRLRYLLVRSWMKKHRHIPDPSSAEILEIAKGVLSTCRVEKSLELSPFKEDFILALSNLTARGGHFNLRMFIRSLDKVLRLSLAWERERTEISVEFMKKTDLLDAIVENLKIEDKKETESSILAKAEEIQKKMQAAREISEYLLTGRVDPPTRYMFDDVVKKIVSRKFQIPILDDIAIIAYSNRKKRTKVHRLIRELRETPKPNKRVIQILEWLFLSEP